jgi:hypothetical protein
MNEFTKIAMELLASGHLEEADELLKMAARLSEKDREMQLDFFREALEDLGVRNHKVSIDMKKGEASFILSGMNIIELPSFLERFMTKINDIGTRNYTLASLVRNSPMRVNIKL